MRLLDDAGCRGTFLTVGWVAHKFPDLIRRLAREGHEVGCHSFWHRLVYKLAPEDFEADLVLALEILRDLTGQPVDTYRAPGFSVKDDTFWCYPILRKHGITTDISVVPARRDHGGVASFPRDPFVMETSAGDIRCFPVSVMTVAGRRIPFSGGGYLRLFPLSLVKSGFRENHRQGRPGMSYIHPREINPRQPRFERPPVWRPVERLKYLKYYVNLDSTQPKLTELLRTFRFTTVRDVLDQRANWPRYRIDRAAGPEGRYTLSSA
jgi:polysaccharide deacetylase family protein (PEP-CTERM system associated)